MHMTTTRIGRGIALALSSATALAALTVTNAHAATSPVSGNGPWTVSCQGTEQVEQAGIVQFQLVAYRPVNVKGTNVVNGRYVAQAAGLRTASQARALARLDDDGLLKYREDGALWTTTQHVAGGRTVSDIQTVNVSSLDVETYGSLAAAIKVNSIGHISVSTAPITSVKPGVTYWKAWELDPNGASTAYPWGADRTLPQRDLSKAIVPTSTFFTHHWGPIIHTDTTAAQVSKDLANGCTLVTVK